MKFYHGTYGVYLDSILEKGLIANYNTSWDFSERYIYLSDDPEIALTFAEVAEEVPEEYLKDIVIIEIDSKDLDIARLSIDSNIIYDLEEKKDPYSFQYKGIIKPKAITIYSRYQN
jgi:thiol-disulfide isomerase/thioredoxin